MSLILGFVTTTSDSLENKLKNPHRCLTVVQIIPIPHSNINRGEDGRPKTQLDSEGIRRLAPSPQFRKYSIRHTSDYGNYITRSRWIPMRILRKVGLTETSPLWGAWLKALILALYKDTKAKHLDKGHMAGLILLSNKEIDAIETYIQPLISSNPPKNLYDGLQNVLSNVAGGDISSVVRAFYGRMATNSPMIEHRDSALQCGPSFSLQGVKVQDDYTSCVDDEVRDPSGLCGVITQDVVDEEGNTTDTGDTNSPSGAGHITSKYVATACDLFTEDTLDLDQIAINEGYASLEAACADGNHRQDIIDVITDWLLTAHFRPLGQAANRGNYDVSKVRASYTLIRATNTPPSGTLSTAVRYAYHSRGEGDRITDQAIRDINTYINNGKVTAATYTLSYGEDTTYTDKSFEKDVRDLLDSILP